MDFYSGQHQHEKRGELERKYYKLFMVYIKRVRFKKAHAMRADHRGIHRGGQKSQIFLATTFSELVFTAEYENRGEIG